MTSNRSLEAARDALEALESRRAELLAAVEGARTAVSDAEAERDALISRAAAGDKKATRDVIRRADDAWRDAQISLKIEEAKVSAIDNEIAQAEIEVMRAKARTLSDDLRSASIAEAAAFDALLTKVRQAQDALRTFEEAEMVRFRAYQHALQHNSSPEVQRAAYPGRPEQNVWQPPAPVTVTQEGSMLSTSFDRNGELIPAEPQANVQQDDPSFLATLQGRSATIQLGEVGTAFLRAGGWTVRGLKDLEELARGFAASV